MFAPIHIAAWDADVDALRAELGSGVDPNLINKDDQSKTPLHYLCLNARDDDLNSRSGKIEARFACLQALISAGANLNAATVDGTTPLHYAATWIFVDSPFMQALIDGCDVHVPNSAGSTALHVAAWFGNVKAVTALIRGGAVVNTLDDVCDALEMARVRGKHRVYPILLQSGASLPAVCVSTTPDAPYGLHTPYGPYLQRVVDAGGWANYERLQLDRLAGTFALRPVDGRRRSQRRPNRLVRLPPELIRRVMEFWAHAGYY